jgi:UDP-galactopyranose mutase
MKKILIVGAGITGMVLAQRFASRGGRVVLVEKRDHIGGNCYDCENENGILVHQYGPHIFHTDDRRVWDYLSQFTNWINYSHQVLGFIDNKYVHLPFNLNTLHGLMPDAAPVLEKKLVAVFGIGAKIPILKLRESSDPDLKNLADFIYEKVFLHYTVKQWGLKPDQIDPAVSGRVPVVISRDNRYFSDKFQGIPAAGYAKLFGDMMESGDIDVILKTDYKDIGDAGRFGQVFYTGPIDEFFGYKFGKLDYRSVKIDLKTFDCENYQEAAVINYPNDNEFTRVTEFKKLTGQINKKTVIGFEYPGTEGFAAYPVLDKKNRGILAKYQKEAEILKARGIYFSGRLAEYRYYDMDDAVKAALDLSAKIV